METINDDTFRAMPSVSRYALVIPFLTLLFALPVYAFLKVCISLGGALGGHHHVTHLLWGVGFGIAALSLITVYLANTFVFCITLSGDKFSFVNGNRSVEVPIDDIAKICYIDSLSGANTWMYIVIYTSYENFTLPNLMYFDKQFEAIRDGLSECFVQHGLGNLIHRDAIGPQDIGFFGNTKLSFSFLTRGIWKHIAFFAAIAALTASLSAWS